MENEECKKIVNKIHKKYCKFIGKDIPKLNDIIIVTETCDFFARFLVEDLYNKKYILYICDELFNQSRQFISQILFHEFTHELDSIKFLKKDFLFFQNVMLVYSEFHASKIELDKAIRNINKDINEINKDTFIYVNNEMIDIEFFVNNAFNNIEYNFKKIENCKSAQNCKYEDVYIFYFYGYISCLEKYNIDYEYHVSKLSPYFVNDITNIGNELLKDKINYKTLFTLYNELVLLIS